MLIVLSAAAEPRASLALPLLVPLALLGAAEVDTLKRGYSGALDWFGILTFGLLALLLWGCGSNRCGTACPRPSPACSAIRSPATSRRVQPWLRARLGRSSPLLWLALVRPARRSNRRAVLNWAAGMTLVWGLFATIWLPYLDSRRSYRPVAESLAAHLPAGRASPAAISASRSARCSSTSAASSPCATSPSRTNDCPALLLQLGRDDSDIPPDSAWEKIWEGRRRGDDTERFILFRRGRATQRGLHREVRRRSDDRGHRRRRRQRRGLVPAREVRAARRTRRRRRRPRRQHLRGRRPQHQHADRLSLRAHPPRQARRERPRRRPVRTRRASDIVLRMPVGTVITDADTGELVADLAHRRRSARCVAKGGKGGLGNLHFKSSTNRAPRQFDARRAGRAAQAQARAARCSPTSGLLGMPNAGKSTLIRAISAARPKVADYPFTTLHPHLGVVRVDANRSFVVADIPGLIEGAAEGAGLGHQFLRHLQRTRLLLHLVDIAPFDPEVDPVRRRARDREGAQALRRRRCYDKPRWLVLNKLDLIPADERDARVAALRQSLALEGPGVRDLGDQRRGLPRRSSTRCRTGWSGIARRRPLPRARRQRPRRERPVQAGCVAHAATRSSCVSRSARAWSPTTGAASITPRSARWAEQIAALRAAASEVVLVSSRRDRRRHAAPGLDQAPGAMHELQAAAAVGQMGLVQAYETAFARFGLHTAQVLLTHEDLADRQRYLNARSTLRDAARARRDPDHQRERHRRHRRDPVRRQRHARRAGHQPDRGRRAGDPHRPAGPVHAPIRARIPTRRWCAHARAGDPALEAMAGGAGSALGSGGMLTKVLAAKRAARSGAHHGDRHRPRRRTSCAPRRRRDDRHRCWSPTRCRSPRASSGSPITCSWPAG